MDEHVREELATHARIIAQLERRVNDLENDMLTLISDLRGVEHDIATIERKLS